MGLPADQDARWGVRAWPTTASADIDRRTCETSNGSKGFAFRSALRLDAEVTSRALSTTDCRSADRLRAGTSFDTVVARGVAEAVGVGSTITGEPSGVAPGAAAAPPLD